MSSKSEMTLCFECRVAPSLLVLDTPKGEMYSYGCDQCKYFVGENHTIMGAQVQWHRTNCNGQSEGNLKLRRERMGKIRSGEIKISVKEKRNVTVDP